MRRIRIQLAYDGGGFHGWQVQPGLPTIQGALEEILTGMEGAPVAVAGSGRTDAGVHALAQVAAFTISNPIPPENLRRAINRLLPPAIRVTAVEEAPLDFHPRFQAKAKTYEYRMVRRDVVQVLGGWLAPVAPDVLVPAAADDPVAGLLLGNGGLDSFATRSDRHQIPQVDPFQI